MLDAGDGEHGLVFYKAGEPFGECCDRATREGKVIKLRPDEITLVGLYDEEVGEVRPNDERKPLEAWIGAPLTYERLQARYNQTENRRYFEQLRELDRRRPF